MYNSIVLKSKQGYRVCAVPFPHRKMKGTPSQRSLFISQMEVAKVGVLEAAGTLLSSRYP